MNPATTRSSPTARMVSSSSRVRRVTAVRRPPMAKTAPLESRMKPLTTTQATEAEKKSPAMKKMTYSEDAARNIESGHYCNNGQSVEDRVKVQRLCNRAPSTMKGGMRKRFHGEGVTESLVRKIVARCKDRMYCDIGVTRDGKQKKGKVNSLCDTGSQAGVCGAAFAKKYNLEIDVNCKTKLTDASGNEMSVVGCTKVWLRPSKLDGEDNLDGEFMEYELVVNEEMGSDIFLGRNDLERMGVIPHNFPSVWSNMVRRVEAVDEVDQIENNGMAAGCDTNGKVINATTESNKMAQMREKVEKLKTKYSDIFGDITSEKFCTVGGPMKIHLYESDEEPYRAMTARRPPRALQDKADKLLRQLEKAGVISRVYWPTPWASPAMFCPKPNSDKVRMVTDFTRLNKRVKRAVHGAPTARQIREKLKPSTRFFCVLDLNHGYFQIELAEESKDLTTFIVSENDTAVRYRYNRAPQGLASSGDEFCARTDEAFEAITGLQKLIDDVIIESDTLEELLKKMETVFERCRQHGIILSEEKIQVGPKVKFGGWYVDATSGEVEITPDPELLRDIREFPKPKNLKQLRSFQGLVNQITSWNPDVAQHLSGMRELLKRGNAYVWTDVMDEQFNKAREVMSESRTIKPFDPTLETVLVTDASRTYGIGFLLLQRREQGDGWNIVQCGSYATTETQKRYSATELEMLGVLVGCKKCHYFLQGLDSFKVWTDHSALKQVFQKDIQDVPNPRLRAFREKMMDMNSTVEHIKGKRNEAADALSRVPMWRMSEIKDPSEEIFQVRRTLFRRWHGIQKKSVTTKTDGGKEVTKQVRTITPSMNYAREDVQLKKMFIAVKEDQTYQMVVERLKSGMTKEEVIKLPKGDPAREYREVWDRLTTIDDKPDTIMLVDNLRLVVPEKCRADILKALHLPHAGVNKTREMANERYYWVGMSRDIGDTVGACVTCTKRHNSKPNDPPAELRWSAKELEPMMMVSADHFSIGKKKYLICVDRYSSFPFVTKVVRMTTEETIEKLEDIFNVVGWPESIRSDGGPAFRKEFGEWCKSKGIKWELSSSYYARSNGSCEVRIGTSKKCMIKCMEEGEDVDRALSNYRNMPAKDGHTPSSMFFRRILRSPDIPALRRKYTDEERERDEALSDGFEDDDNDDWEVREFPNWPCVSPRQTEEVLCAR